MTKEEVMKFLMETYSGKLPEASEEFSDEFEDEEECMHDEHDHGYCLDCGEDIMDNLMAKAEDAWEGDR